MEGGGDSEDLMQAIDNANQTCLYCSTHLYRMGNGGASVAPVYDMMCYDLQLPTAVLYNLPVCPYSLLLF